MKTFPMFVQVAGRTIVVAGGGEAAAQKARLARKTEARLTLMAPELNAELRGLVKAGQAAHAPSVLDPDAFDGAALAFVATGCAGADAAIAAVARDRGALVNVVDRPELCDAVTPAIVDRDPVVVAIGTEGAAPVLARRIKSRIEEILEPSLGRLAALAGGLREAAARRIAPEKRRAFWAWVFSGAPRRLFAAGCEAQARAAIDAALAAGGAPVSGAGLVSLVGAGPGAADLMTLRGVQRLQEADIVYYDRLVGEDVLELARRDAERVYVGKRPGCAAWPQAKINELIVQSARRGLRVARLKCGDPLVFGRAGEEADACEAAGVPWEVVPGVTSALAAAAAAKVFPTRRGESARLTFATGASADGAPPPDFAATAAPGGVTAYYMCVGAAPTLAAELLQAGAPSSLEVVIVENASGRQERVVRACLGGLAEAVAGYAVTGPAIVFVRWPRAEAAAAPVERRAAHEA